jgi:hypothetical protein
MNQSPGHSVQSDRPLSPSTSSIYLEQAAAELAAMGLLKPGRLVLTVAAQCPPMTDLRFCDYVDNPIDTKNNVKMWLWGQERPARKLRERSRELLRRAGIDDWQEKLARD